MLIDGLIPLYRLWSTGAGDHLYTTSAAERDSARARGYADEDVACRVISGENIDAHPHRAHLVRLFRLFHAGSRDHFYTTRADERSECLQHGWHDEGDAGWVFTPNLPDDHPLRSGLVPLFRLWNVGVGDHFYTVDPDENTSVQARGWKSEGFVGYVVPRTAAAAPAPAPTLAPAAPAPEPVAPPPLPDPGPLLDLAACRGHITPLHRFWNLGVGDHLYTINRAERDHLRDATDWHSEGIECHVIVPDIPDAHPLRPHLVPLHRLWNQAIHDHFYTLDVAERDASTHNGWHKEGVACLVFPAQLAPNAPLREHLRPLFRMWNPKAGDHFYTVDAEERARARSRGWNDQGVACHVLARTLPDGQALLAPGHEDAATDLPAADAMAGVELTTDAPAPDRSIERPTDTVTPDRTFDPAAPDADITGASSGTLDLTVELTGIHQRIKAELEFPKEPDIRRDAQFWGYLEHAVLRDFERHVEVLTSQIARLELMFRHHGRTIDSRFEAGFKAWADHFREQMTGLVNTTVVHLVESQAAAAMARHTIKLRHELDAAAAGDLEARIAVIVDARLAQQRSEIVSQVENTLERLIHTHVDHKLLKAQAATIDEVMHQIDALIGANVDQRVAGATIKIDVDIDGRLLAVQDGLASLRNQLSARMDAGDDRLKAWISAQLIQLKGCMTDRHEFVDQLKQFTVTLETRLAEARCVDVREWARSDEDSGASS